VRRETVARSRPLALGNASSVDDVAEPDSLEQRLDPVVPPRWAASEPLTVASVRDVFEARVGHTVGIEEELMLLDPETLELAPLVDRALAAVEGDERFVPELREGQIEIRTPVSGNAVAAGIQLAEARLVLAERLEGRASVAVAGTHPTSSAWGDVTGGERYRLLAEEYPYAARGHVPSGLHVHVGVSGAERALAVFNAVRSFLPEIVALAVNSPFLEGADTGLASVRSQLTLAYHRAGVPPALPSWDAYVEFVEWARRGGLLADARHLWWDLRPHPVHGTLELRATDAQTRVDDAVAIGAVYQALLTWLSDRLDEGETLPIDDGARIAENLWRANRYGARGWMVDPRSGATEETRARVSRMLDALEPTAARLGTGWALLGARTLLADNAADRQRYVAEREGVSGLVRWLADETVSSATAYLERPG
jgi:carboxylate-amine ligase